MNTLPLLFDPLPSSLLEQMNLQEKASSHFRLHYHSFPDLDNREIAIIGLPSMAVAHPEGSQPKDLDAEGAWTEVEMAALYQSPDAIRAALYPMGSLPLWPGIVDLGNLRPGPYLEETMRRVSEVINCLRDLGIQTIILAEDQAYTIAQYRSVQEVCPLPRLAVVDRQIDWDDRHAISFQPKWQSDWLSKLIASPSIALQSLTVIGYQEHLGLPDLAETGMEERIWVERLGFIKENMLRAEPYLRQAEVVSIDMAAIQGMDFRAQYKPRAFGFSGIEAAQMAWFAGFAPWLESFGIYGYLADRDDADGLGAEVAATLVWYFLKSRSYAQPADFPFSPDKTPLTHFVMGDDSAGSQDILMVTSAYTGRSWLLTNRDCRDPYAAPKEDWLAIHEKMLNELDSKEIPIQYLRAVEAWQAAQRKEEQ